LREGCCREAREGCEAVVIAERGDGERRSYYVRLRRGASFTTIAGVVRSSEVLSEGWGWQFRGRMGRLAVVPPTVFDMMEGFLERRTQVIYPKDLGLIVLLAGLKPGSFVLEAGSGSGFLTAAAAIAVCPNGRVYSFDVRRENLEAARRNLRRLGLEECVEFRLGDVRDPRTLRDLPALDAALLDMPDPWNAMPALHGKLRDGAPLVSFLPTADQVEKIVSAAGDCWVVQDAFETMARRIEVKEGAFRPGQWVAGFTGYIVVLRKLRSGSEACVRPP
jgi:tRNA (adenine57-N1/adenine58-N1)-methyltransferase